MKKIILNLFMLSMIFSVQISFNGCDDSNEDSDPDPSGSATQFPSSNNYSIEARIIGLNLGFGGLSACADVSIIEDGQIIDDAIVTVNSDTIQYSYGTYQASISTSSDYNLSIIHNENIIAIGTANIPSSVPEITNLDSGDVHSINADLTINWSSIDDITSWQISGNNEANDNYTSDLLPLNVTSHTIPGSYFNSGGGTVYDIQLSAINGLYPGDDAAMNDPEVGYDIEGPKGYFIGITQSEVVQIFVND